MNLPHLARRFFTSLSHRPPSSADRDWAHSWLDEGERDLWDSMSSVDRRHSIQVARLFHERRRTAGREEMAGALLHDAGKTASGFGTFSRVIATIVGPRTKRLREYHDHEAIGAAMAEAAGSDPVTVDLVRGEGPAAGDLQAADDSI
jgi:hypothetical protein